MENWIYLSHPLSDDAPGYGGQKIFSSQPDKEIRKGDSCNTSIWKLSNHSGTHIDFPRHFFDRGNTMGDYKAGFFIFERVFVADISVVEPGMIIGSDDLNLANAPNGIELLFIKTGFGKYRGQPVYWQKNPGFHPDLAEYLRKAFPKLRAIGFDSISLSSFASRDLGREAHKAFLDHDHPILPIEDMDLGRIDKNHKINRVIVAPMHVAGADGAPCTVMAMTGKVSVA